MSPTETTTILGQFNAKLTCAVSVRAERLVRRYLRSERKDR